MKRRILLSMLMVMLVFVSSMSFFSTPVSAQSAPINQPPDLDKATYVWLNANAIKATVGGQTIEFDYNNSAARGGGRIERYFYPAGYICTDHAHNRIFVNVIGNNFGQVGINLQYNPPNTIGNCASQYTNNNITIGSPQNAFLDYLLSSDKTTITSLDGKTIYQQDTAAGSNGDIYVKQNDTSSCPAIMVTNDLQTSYTIYSTSGSGNSVLVPGANITPGCTNKYKAQFTGTLGTQADNGGNSSNSGGGANNTNNSPGYKCSVTFKNPLTWLVCPVLDGIQDIMNQVGQIIGDFLTVPGKYFDTSTAQGKAIFDAWDSMRNIALAVLGITALIMVLSQTLSFGPFDAYTVKKLLPRILVAAILITLSWSLVQLMVAVSNGLGDSVRSLIFQPFAHIGDLKFNNQTLGLGLVGGLGAISVLSIFGVLSLGLTAALALMVGLAVIVIRQILVILLAILAPVAIVCYILPGTDKAWKLWWDSFSGVLLMFPIIEAFIAAGQVFSKIASTNTTGGQTINQIIAFLALYIPYFLLPAAVRLAGGVISSIGGLVNDRSKGVFDRLKKGRQSTAARNVAKLRAGNRYEGKSYIPGSRAFARGVNAASVRVGSGPNGNFGFGEKGRQAVDQIRRRAMEEQIMKSPAWSGIHQNDDALHAATYSSAGAAQSALRERFRSQLNDDVSKGKLSAAEADIQATERADKAVRATQASIGFGRPQAIAAAQQLVATGTGYNDLGDMVETLARASGGNENTARALSGYANSVAKEKGRWELAPSYSVLEGMVRHQAGLTDFSGQSPNDSRVAKPVVGGVANSEVAKATVKASRGADAVTMLRGKPLEVKNLTTALSQHLNEQWATWSDVSLPQADRVAARDEAIVTAGQLRQIDDAKGYASPEVQAHVNQAMADTAASRTSIKPYVDTGTDPNTGRANPPSTDLQKLWVKSSAPPPNPYEPRLP